MTRPHLAKAIFAAIGIILIATFFVARAVHFMREEHTLYCWDAIGNWQFGAELLNRPDHSLLGRIAAFGRTMHHDYNLLCALPATVTMAVWGTSRFCYITANVVFLILPAVFVCLWLFFGLGTTTWSRASAVVLAFLALLASPILWLVTLTGLTDVGGLVMAAVATDLCMHMDIRSRKKIPWMAIGAALAMIALCKRWYLFLVVGLLAVLFAEVAIDWILTTRRTRSITLASIVATASGPFLLLSSLVLVYCLSFPLPLRVATTNYSQIYSGYQNGNSWIEGIGVNLSSVTQAFGLAQVLLAFVGFIALLCFPRWRHAAIYLFVPGCFALAYFSRVQTMADHQKLLVFLAIAATPIFLARQLLASSIKSERVWGWATLGSAALISCLSFQSVFASSPPFGSSVVQNLFPYERLQPAQRHDLGEVEALLRFLGDKVVSPPGQAPEPKVYVLCSSLYFNSSIVSTAGFQLNKSLPAQDYIFVSNDVDLRDGFPDALLTAPFVVVADPIQTHLRKEQKVVTVPARMFLEGTGFAQAFVRDSQTFHLNRGVTVYVFDRVRPSTPEEIAQLRKEVGVPSMATGGAMSGLNL